MTEMATMTGGWGICDDGDGTAVGGDGDARDRANRRGRTAQMVTMTIMVSPIGCRFMGPNRRRDGYRPQRMRRVGGADPLQEHAGMTAGVTSMISSLITARASGSRNQDRVEG